MAKILITGGSGLVGKELTKQLLHKNHEVVWLSRTENLIGKIKVYKWDYTTNYIDERAFDGVTAIIHLAGAGIADKRWTENYKKEILDSRIKTSALLIANIKKLQLPITTFIGASAIGYYGAINSEEIFDETKKAGNDFLGNVCLSWENSYKPIIEKNIRTIVFRIGIVLAKDGGALNKMKPLFKIGLGSALADGTQFFPWIHITDVVNAMIFSLENILINGTYNVVGTEHINNYNFSNKLAQCYNKKMFLPNVPKFILKLAMGEGAVMVYTGIKISNNKLKQAGFNFSYNSVNDAIQNCCV